MITVYSAIAASGLCGPFTVDFLEYSGLCAPAAVWRVWQAVPFCCLLGQQHAQTAVICLVDDQIVMADTMAGGASL